MNFAAIMILSIGCWAVRCSARIEMEDLFRGMMTWTLE